MTDEQRYKRHKEILLNLHKTYISKNKDYGNSFSEMYRELGCITALTRIGDKYNRLKSLMKKSEAERLVKDEAITDTLLDMANYAIMTVIEIEAQKNEKLSTGN